MRRRLTLTTLSALFAVAVSAAPALAQTGTAGEAQLLQRAAQYPNEIDSLLELARLYFSQQRYEDAQRTLARAQSVIQQVQARSAMTAQQATGTESGPVYRVGGDIREPIKIKDVAPIYPTVAKNAKITGYVILEIIVGPDGSVRDLKVVKSMPLLDAAAVNAVRQWKYAPPVVNGQPASVVMSVTVIFQLK
jgi:TonB family protein